MLRLANDLHRPFGITHYEILLSYSRHVKTSCPHFPLQSSRTSVLRDTVDVAPNYAALVDLTGSPDVVYPGTHRRFSSGLTMPPSDAEVEQATRDFRSAIDAAGPEPWAQKHITYPRGACGHVAELLGRYLIDRLGITADYVNQDAHEDIGGWRHSHSWLEWNGLTIDISGDQFGWEKVIVTRIPAFHGRGETNSRHPVCLEHQQDWWWRECGPLWVAIRPHLPA